ncbi:hypothetical protein MPRF_56680 [Mycolicibacterium parafortuitum]|uniref:Uncharacterized protein n=1 Tax=Mycolicibacterium parafortuitum TaxID=39692 RepID=A0A7I7UDM2_MYCPF|nr:hypothetical protein MPRF_56680 [Mycolicibacterium parafortuitum]
MIERENYPTGSIGHQIETPPLGFCRRPQSKHIANYIEQGVETKAVNKGRNYPARVYSPSELEREGPYK